MSSCRIEVRVATVWLITYSALVSQCVSVVPHLKQDIVTVTPILR